ncbi:MAG: RlmE family RNA methyltransferase [Spirochaetales bacterium]|nr:RlmE family RNA methyltransferase [Spirochaetales bacterium]
MAKKGRRRQDHLARRAQTEGYRARSVYKLEAIDDKFGIFPKARNRDLHQALRVLDLGAAPGSWTQYAVERGAEVVAIDIREMAVAGAECLVGDFTDSDVATRLAESGPFDAVLSDAAPSTTGNRVVDTGRSEALVESILARAEQWLSSGGVLVCKVFQGGGEQRLLRDLRAQYERGFLFRPKAVRSESFESYLVGIGFHGR